jgi:hypothetical protein
MDTFNKLLNDINQTNNKKVSFNNTILFKEIENCKNTQNDINMEDYEPVEEETSKYVDCMNICHIYFKNLFRKEHENMFYNIDEKDEYSTNREMEFVYETIYKYNINLANNTNLCDIYEPNKINDYLNKNDYNELYGLSFDNQIIKVCPSLFGIITYIAHHIDWKNDDIIWAIIPLKTE